jgi:peptidoglycan-associated lipoprotein
MLEKDLQAVQAELKTIYFDYDKYALDREAQTKLQYNAQILQKAPEVKIVVEGHCDERGTAEYNLALGARRAKAAADYLVSLGVAPERVKTVSYGSELPVATGHNEAAWSQNRRAYFRVVK